MYRIHLGIPEMEELWNRLEEKHRTGSANKNEEKLRRQMGKACCRIIQDIPDCIHMRYHLSRLGTD